MHIHIHIYTYIHIHKLSLASAPLFHAELAAFMIVYIVHRTLTLLCDAHGRQDVIEVPSCTSRTSLHTFL